MMMAPPLSNYSNYLGAVREALEQQPGDWTFKSDPRYREVLEHTPVEFAEAMLKWSMKALPDLDLDYVRSLCSMNDAIGKPVQEPIADLGTFAPSNMRYLCHAIKMWQHIDSLGLPQVNIVEIGGGYGGLAFYVTHLRSRFRTTFWNYAIVDLLPVAELTAKVLHRAGVFAHTIDGTYPPALDRFAQSGLPLVCVSAYAFSEFDQETRDWYAERILKHCRHGLMIWNFPEARESADGRWFGGPPYQFVDWPITRVPDVPALYDGHEMVTW